MKKLFSIVFALALVLTVLAGCQASLSAPQPPAEPPANVVPLDAPVEPLPPAPPAQAATKLTADQALEIALKDAGLTKEQIHDLDVELDNDGGAVHYDVDFEVNDKDYDYEIDAESGNILKKDVPKAPAAAPASASSSSSKNIGRTKARDIALKHAGLSASQVRDLEVELDKEGGKSHYDVDFEADGYDYDYEIDAESGKILKSRKEKD
jgi:uncharacterized membrane protein YkoI